MAIANLLVARDQKLKYEQYVELCQEKNTKPLDRAEYNQALFALEQDARIKGYKLKIEYKKKKIDIKSDIKKLKAEKYLMDKTAFQEKLQELKGQLKENKANFRSKVADIDSSYLAERKAKYGHFYY
jgi:glutathione synthase/RimK-type ligase-like ATP-grasp enzyme